MIGLILQNWRRIVRHAVQLSVIMLLASPLMGFSFFRGSLISAELFGITLTDPLAAINFMLATKSIYVPVIVSVIPVAVFYFLVGGRVFCSWTCPVFLATEIVGKLGRRLAVARWVPHHSVRFWVLGVVMGLSLVTARPVFEAISPIGITSQNLAMAAIPPAGRQVQHDDEFAAQSSLPIAESLLPADSDGWREGVNGSLLVLAALLVIDLFLSRAWWCRYVCPVGALYTLLGRFSPTKIKITHSACTQCEECYDVCMTPEVLYDPVNEQSRWVNDAACSNCLNCVDVCPTQALGIGIKLSKER